MHIIPIAWLYVALMMAVVEATSSTGSLLGAIVTFILYGVLPISVVMYLLGTPLRWRAIKARERAELAATPLSPSAAALGITPDAGSEAAADAITPVRKET